MDDVPAKTELQVAVEEFHPLHRDLTKFLRFDEALQGFHPCPEPKSRIAATWMSISQICCTQTGNMKGYDPSSIRNPKSARQKKTESFPAYEIASARGSMIFKSFCSEDAASTDLLHRSRPRLRVQPSIVAKFEQNQKGNNTLQPCKELKKVFFSGAIEYRYNTICSVYD